MNELSARAQELVDKVIEEHSFSWAKSSGRRKVRAIVEQALLAEQQLAIKQCAVDCKYETGWSRGYKAAMEEAAKIAESCVISVVLPVDNIHNRSVKLVGQALRAAAGKEVGTR